MLRPTALLESLLCAPMLLALLVSGTPAAAQGSPPPPGEDITTGQPPLRPPSYAGPGDSVGGGFAPQPGGAPPPPTAPGAPAPAGPVPGAPAAPAPPMPPPGWAGSPSGPTTPDVPPFEADPASWRLWWHFERHAFLARPERLVEHAARTGSDDFFLGLGEQRELPPDLRPSAAEVRDLALPALVEALLQSPPEELRTRALIALGRLEEPAASPAFHEIARLALASRSTVVAEAALLATGLHGDAEDLDLLLEALWVADAPRERAFAAYALGLGASEAPLPDRERVLSALFQALGDERDEVHAAAVCAISLIPLPHGLPGAPFTRDEQIEGLLAYLLHTPDAWDGARAHVPVALARLSEGLPPERGEELARTLLTLVVPHSPESNEVRRGAVLGLTALRLPEDSAVRADVQARLMALGEGQARDRLERQLAVLGVGRSAGPADEGVAREWLRRRLAGGRTQERCFAALGLGLLERASEAPSSPSFACLRTALADASGPEEAGAICIALGLAEDVGAIPVLVQRVEGERDEEVRGYAALALGLIGDRECLEPLCDALATSMGKPRLLRRTATALALLGDDELAADLARRLVAEQDEETLGALASAMGWVGDPRALAELCGHVTDDGAGASGRSWCAVAIGRLCDPGPPAWAAPYAIGSNYTADARGTLTDPYFAAGVLDLP